MPDYALRSVRRALSVSDWPEREASVDQFAKIVTHGQETAECFIHLVHHRIQIV